MKTETTKTTSYLHPTMRVVMIKSRAVLCQSGLQDYRVDPEEDIDY